MNHKWIERKFNEWVCKKCGVYKSLHLVPAQFGRKYIAYYAGNGYAGPERPKCEPKNESGNVPE